MSNEPLHTNDKLKQTILPFDVFVSPPVTADTMESPWPGPEPRRSQQTLQSYMNGSGNGSGSGDSNRGSSHGGEKKTRNR